MTDTSKDDFNYKTWEYAHAGVSFGKNGTCLYGYTPNSDAIVPMFVVKGGCFSQSCERTASDMFSTFSKNNVRRILIMNISENNKNQCLRGTAQKYGYGNMKTRDKGYNFEVTIFERSSHKDDPAKS